jgi:hypothetical protein
VTENTLSVGDLCRVRYPSGDIRFCVYRGRGFVDTVYSMKSVVTLRPGLYRADTTGKLVDKPPEKYSVLRNT